MGVDKGKKLKAADKNDEENAEPIDAELVVSIEKLQEIQDELEKINEKASDEVLEVEQKYNKIRKPVYGKRNEIINAIPDFWLTVILSDPVLGELLTEEDQKIFKYLSSLDVEDSKDVKSGYSITFIFRSNPYFEDTKLTKAFTFLDEGTTKVTSTSIKWKEGSEIISNGISDKKGNKRPFHEESNSHGKENVEDMNDDVAEIIKEDLWPNPLSYFNNEADDEEDSEGEGGFEEGQDGECSEEDEEEEDAEDGEK